MGEKRSTLTLAAVDADPRPHKLPGKSGRQELAVAQCRAIVGSIRHVVQYELCRTEQRPANTNRQLQEQVDSPNDTTENLARHGNRGTEWRKPETLDLLKLEFGNENVNKPTTFRWFSRFENGMESVKDEKRVGRPILHRNPEKKEDSTVLKTMNYFILRIKNQFRERFERRKDNLSRVSSCKLERILLHRIEPMEGEPLMMVFIPKPLSLRAIVIVDSVYESTITIARKLKGFGMKTIFRGSPSMGSILRNPITKSTDQKQKKDLVYQIPCLNCNSVYIVIYNFNNNILLRPFALAPNDKNTRETYRLNNQNFLKMIEEGYSRLEKIDAMTLLHSKLGWILSGNVSSSETGNSYISLFSTSQGDDNLRKFFELESVPAALPLTKEEKSCGDIYDKNFCISTDGRYSVGLPFKSVPNLGDSRQNAMKRFLALERKLHKSSNLLQQYKDFMMEYLSLNHMELIPKNERDKPSDKCYYIPHHCVLREQSSTTKLRVVFDASCKTSNNYSLNEFLHTGPKLQHDIFNILVKFRTNPIAFTGDIEKMYRQIKVNSSDLDFQRIFWRNSPLESLLEYRLLTVTYGMSCAPYLAIRTLMQLATDKELLFPEASKIIKTDFYVDDLLSGATTIEEVKVLIDDIRRILLSGGFCIRKWMSNVPEVLSEVPEALKAHDSYEIGDNSSVKILGINWNPSTDNFTITVNSLNDVYSKRQLLSDISRIYDPLGWLSPVIISFKILFQTLWKQDLDWDDPLSESLCSHWRRVKMDLAMLNHIKIPRYISCKGLIHSLELRGFCDASESAYSLVVYMKSRFKSGHVQVTLIAAKTKVAPLKATSIPRLELCAALLLSNLYDSICSSLLLQIERVILWTDSQIVLCWIKSESKHWKPFFGNRIAEIQRLTLQSSWYYVSTKDNPADCASRGITSSELVNHSSWWNGPDWLSNSSLQDPLPITYELLKEVCHEKRKTVPIVHFTICPILDFIFKFSTFRKLSRVTAWLLRFIHNARHSSDKIKHKELSSNELDNSILTLIQIIQSSEFKTEIQCCNQSKVLPSNSKPLSLNPFIDSSGILRVGGRLRKSNLQFNEKHPIILPHNHFITELIVQQFQVEHLHSGLQLTLCAIRQKYWIPSGRILVKKLINRCMTCFKTKRQVSKQIMGDLPIHRIIPSSPFSKTGIDFAGPFITKPNVIRTKVTLKSYIALFICFSTKAIHLEIVSDLSTPAFLAAFRRFISRRGKPSDIFTDNATNFKGAKNILNNIHQLVKDSSIQSYVANEHITWHFIPLSAPNFGGIWEAGIKSLKYHLLRCLNSAVLNFEELNTLTSQIGACLNSRPLYPMSSDPNDFNPLTPGHFLIGRPLTALPEPSYHPNDNYLSRWKLIQKARDVFSQRWSREYLNNLQQRSKWKKPSSNLKVGDLVLVKHFLCLQCSGALAASPRCHLERMAMSELWNFKQRNNII
ncbi:hypothetical protein LAZ67_8001068 [Cordylochernes scorpioides]|uniref:Integrase catalytic domain-containing protein n=1 Tax=Cordylochernes scorpioides TaxID=51811 RepID=A0ABY6KPV6_9ARAC|nr:hypothetical protein LAZ67_8001068 [Cordylochernes scorpioides]